MNSSESKEKTIGPVRTAALAVGGMVGGGIYVSLGVVIEAAGQWAWASFLVAGIAAWISATAYARLTVHYCEGGGVFDFLEQVGRKPLAGTVSWLLLVGYTLTISVYAHAFGSYISNSFDGNEWTTRLFVAGILIVMVVLNLLGAGKLTMVEVIIVSLNLIILLAVSAIGIFHWAPDQLSAGIETQNASKLFVGAAAIFVAYEGFQLLTYEFDEMVEPHSWFTPVLSGSAAAVVFIYVFVALGMTMIAGAEDIVKNGDVALAVAAKQALGFPGLVLITFAAGFATSAAINSTLFSTAKLASRVARDHELPGWFDHQNSRDIPDYAVILIGVIAGVLALFGSLDSLVEAASLIFVVTFAAVNFIAARELKKARVLWWIGFLLCVAITIVLAIRLAIEQTIPLLGMIALVALVVWVRPKVVRRIEQA